MSIKQSLIDFAITFAVTLLVTGIVTFVWSLTFHGAGTIDWETAFRFAIIFGIILPLTRAWDNKAAQK